MQLLLQIYHSYTVWPKLNAIQPLWTFNTFEIQNGYHWVFFCMFSFAMWSMKVVLKFLQTVELVISIYILSKPVPPFCRQDSGKANLKFSGNIFSKVQVLETKCKCFPIGNSAALITQALKFPRPGALLLSGKSSASYFIHFFYRNCSEIAFLFYINSRENLIIHFRSRVHP